jgi:transcriptional regulator with XRE-family HTH domain
MDFRQLVRDSRHSASEIANKFGLAQSTVYHWMRGQHMPTPCAIHAIAALLGVNVDRVRAALEVSRNRFRGVRSS